MAAKTCRQQREIARALEPAPRPATALADHVIEIDFTNALGQHVTAVTCPYTGETAIVTGSHCTCGIVL